MEFRNQAGRNPPTNRSLNVKIKMQGTEIIATYETLSKLTGDMLLAAKQGEWDRLTELERHCRVPLNQLISHAAAVKLNDSERQRKLEVIRKILADDAQIRELTEPRLTKLLSLLRGSDTARKLAKTYEDGLGY